MARWSVTLVTVIAAAMLARMDAHTVVQLDVWTVSPTAITAIVPDHEPLRTTLADIGTVSVHTPPGRAHASVDPLQEVSSAVSVRQVAPDRLRIRLAVDDASKGHRVIDAVREGYVNAGLEERLRLSSTTSGGAWVAFLIIAGGFAAAALACETYAATARQRRRNRARTAEAGSSA